MWTQLSSELSEEVDRHSQLLGASYNMDMSILEKEHLGLRIRDGEQGPGPSTLLQNSQQCGFFIQGWDICSDMIHFEQEINLLSKTI